MPSNRDFSMLVLVGGAVLPEYTYQGKTYVECILTSPVSYKQLQAHYVNNELEKQEWPVTPYRIQITSNCDSAAHKYFRVFVDGVKVKALALGPHESRVIKGFRDGNVIREFLFSMPRFATDQADRLDGQREDTIGQIVVECWDASCRNTEWKVRESPLDFVQANKQDSRKVTHGDYMMTTSKAGKAIAQRTLLRKVDSWKRQSMRSSIKILYRMGHTLQELGITLKRLNLMSKQTSDNKNAIDRVIKSEVDDKLGDQEANPIVIGDSDDDDDSGKRSQKSKHSKRKKNETDDSSVGESPSKLPKMDRGTHKSPSSSEIAIDIGNQRDHTDHAETDRCDDSETEAHNPARNGTERNTDNAHSEDGSGSEDGEESESCVTPRKTIADTAEDATEKETHNDRNEDESGATPSDDNDTSHENVEMEDKNVSFNETDESTEAQQVHSPESSDIEELPAVNSPTTQNSNPIQATMPFTTPADVEPIPSDDPPSDSEMVSLPDASDSNQRDHTETERCDDNVSEGHSSPSNEREKCTDDAETERCEKDSRSEDGEEDDNCATRSQSNVETETFVSAGKDTSDDEGCDTHSNVDADNDESFLITPGKGETERSVSPSNDDLKNVTLSDDDDTHENSDKVDERQSDSEELPAVNSPTNQDSSPVTMACSTSEVEPTPSDSPLAISGVEPFPATSDT